MDLGSDSGIDTTSSTTSDGVKLSPGTCGSSSPYHSSNDEVTGTAKPPYLPPCRVCGNHASGFHYGVNTCEACKGFFRRSIARKTPYAKCVTDGKCSVQYDGRNSCASCRYEKCLQVGMSKSAIKTGRYTHQKRTKDTKEVQELQNVQLKKHAINEEACETVMKMLANSYRECFPNTTYIFEHPDIVKRDIKKLMKEKNCTGIVETIITSGAFADCEYTDEFSKAKHVDMMECFQKLNSVISGGDDVMVTNPQYFNASKELYSKWTENCERMIRSMVKFAKTIPGFSSLPITDQIVLIKAARADIGTLIKYKHLFTEFQCCVDYCTITGALMLFPFSAMRRLLCMPAEYDAEYTSLHKRIERMHYCISDIAVIAALAILSPDREELKSSDKVEKLREDLIPVLQHTLRTNHPTDSIMLAKSLLLLPQMRICSEYNTKAIAAAQVRYQPDLSPLMEEVLPTFKNL